MKCIVNCTPSNILTIAFGLLIGLGCPCSVITRLDCYKQNSCLGMLIIIRMEGFAVNGTF